nr:immunoglobulin heavy chain junction region [Mus musculus]
CARDPYYYGSPYYAMDYW